MKQRLSIVLSATALAVAVFGSTPVGHAAGSAVSPLATHEEYVPFVTDFPKPATAADPTVAPTTPSPAPKASTSGIDWGDVAIGSGVGAALAALLAGSGIVLTRRARPARS
ncbi:MAG: hypothetical protein ACRDNE_11155 [Gaiellaceae bacterium]